MGVFGILEYERQAQNLDFRDKSGKV